jgi:hypothetical protein
MLVKDLEKNVTSHKELILVDGHVHIHNCCDLTYFLDSAFQNFTVASKAWKSSTFDAYIGALLLAESAGANWFARLERHVNCDNGEIGGWRLIRTAENCSLLGQRSAAETILVIAGRQIVTAEKLEVLALCTDDSFEDGLPLDETVGNARKAGSLVVLPWGTGKWWGKRGKILQRFLESQPPNDIFLGDNSGRPIFWRNPAHFKRAWARGIRILPGSDPLPFSSECWRAGSFGFALTEKISFEHPAADVKRILLESRSEPQPYGSLERPYRFLRNQIAMQLRKRAN